MSNAPLTVHGSAEWQAWTRRLARHADSSIADALARGATLYAKQIGFAEPPPPRRQPPKSSSA